MHSHTTHVQVQDMIKDFAEKKNRLVTLRAVKHHLQYLSQVKAISEDRGISLVSDTGMGSIMRSVLVGCVEVENPDSASRTHTRELAECPRNAGNVWACREHLRVGPMWGLTRKVAAAHPAPPEVSNTHTQTHTHTHAHARTHTRTHAHAHTRREMVTLTTRQCL